MFVDPKIQRKKRLEQLIHEEIAQLMPSILSFERGKVARVTVMMVHASRDLKKVDVFLHTDSPEAFNLIRQRASKLRSMVAKCINLRRTPQLNLLPWVDELQFTPSQESSACQDF